jgi:uncharacterized membrane protein YbaN (DUF454 family)
MVPSTDPELRLARSPLARAAWVSVGTICVGLAALGVVLPGLPTTPFLILATACYARSSERLTRRLLNHRLFGPLIRDYRAGRGIPFRAKVLALVTMTAFSGYALGPGMPEHLVWPRVVVASAAVIGALYILSLPTRRLD